MGLKRLIKSITPLIFKSKRAKSAAAERKKADTANGTDKSGKILSMVEPEKEGKMHKIKNKNKKGSFKF